MEISDTLNNPESMSGNALLKRSVHVAQSLIWILGQPFEPNSKAYI